MPDFYTRDGKALALDDPEEATKKVAAGELGADPAKTYDMVGTDGIVRVVPGNAIPDAFAEGLRFAGPSEVKDYDAKKRLGEAGYSPTGERVAAFVQGLPGGALWSDTAADLGLKATTGALHSGLGVGASPEEAMQDVSDLRTLHPWLNFGGHVAGAIAGGAAAKRGALNPGSFVADIGKAAGGAAERAGLGTAGQLATSLGAEGAYFGADQLADESVLGQSAQHVAESAASTLVASSLFNMVVGGALHGALNARQALGAFREGKGALDSLTRMAEAALGPHAPPGAAKQVAESVEKAAAETEAAPMYGPRPPTAEEAAALKGAQDAAVSNRHPATFETMLKVGPANKSVEAEEARKGLGLPTEPLINDTAKSLTEDLNEMASAHAPTKLEHTRDLKTENVRKLVQTDDVTTPLQAVASRLSQVHEGMATHATADAFTKVQGEAARLGKAGEEAADELLKMLEKRAPEQMEAFREYEKVATRDAIEAERMRYGGTEYATPQRGKTTTVHGGETAPDARAAAGMPAYETDYVGYAPIQKPERVGRQYEGVEYKESGAAPRVSFSGRAEANPYAVEAFPKTTNVTRLHEFARWADTLGALDNLSPEAKRDINTALFRMSDRYKQLIDSQVNWDKYNPARDPSSLKAAAGSIRGMLEDAGIWGEKAAQAQQGINAATSRLIEAEKAVRGLFVDPKDIEKSVKLESVASRLKTITKMDGTNAEAALREYVDAVKENAKAIRDHYGVRGAEVARIEKAAERFRNTLDTRVDEIQLQNTFRAVHAEEVRAQADKMHILTGGGGFAGLAAGSAVGHMFGVGALGGLMAIRAAKSAYKATKTPATQAILMSRREDFARRLPEEVNSSVARFLGAEKGIRAIKSRLSPQMAAKYAAEQQASVRTKLEEVGKQAIEKDDGVGGEMIGRMALRQAFLGAATLVTKAQKDRHEVTAQLMREWSGGDENLMKTSVALAQQAERTIDYLMQQMPPSVQTNPFQPPRLGDGVSEADAQRFVKITEAALDPMTVVTALGDKTITKEQADTLKAVYPKTYEQMQGAIAQGMGALDGKLPYNKAVSLSTLFGVPVAESMKPDFIARMQAAYMSDDQPDPSNDGNGPGRGRPRGPAPKLASQMMTGAQSIEARAST